MIEAIERIKSANADMRESAARMAEILNRLREIEERDATIRRALFDEFHRVLDAIAGR